MSLHAVNIQGINITDSPKKDILKKVQEYLFPSGKNSQKAVKNDQKPLQIVTPNPEQIIYATKDTHFAELLNLADVALPDGIGLVWASQVLLNFPNSKFQIPIKETIPGVDFMEDLVAMAADRHVPIALIGGGSGVAVSTFECLRQKHPDLVGVAMDAPEFTITPSGLSMIGSIEEYFKKLAETLKKQNSGMIFVGLGAPKQEYFMERLMSQLKIENYTLKIVCMSVGGSFDEISGRVKRAPRWVSRLGLKWLWRLILEPWRLKRQLSLVTFVWLVLKERYSLK